MITIQNSYRFLSGEDSWDLIEDVTYNGTLVTQPQTVSNTTIVTMNNDESKMYVGSNKIVYQYSGVAGADINTFSYDSKSFDFYTDLGLEFITDVLWGDDGSKIYVYSSTAKKIYQYSASTNYDISTVSYDSIFISITNSTPTAKMNFNTDYSKLYMWVDAGAIAKYNVSDLNDISTITQDARQTIGSFTTWAYINKNETGIIGGNAATVNYQYTFDVIGDVTGGWTFVSTITLNTGTFESAQRGGFVSNDGTKLLITGKTSENVHQYNL
jgi:hypothetical protein